MGLNDNERGNEGVETANLYQAEFSCLTERLVHGKEAVDMMAEFWDRMAHIEYQYAKSIAQLCNSRHGRLQKMFNTNHKTLEYFRPLQSVWGAVIEDLVTHSESHLNVAYTIQREIKPVLVRFSHDELSKQVDVAQQGKKVMENLKSDHNRLQMSRRKHYRSKLSVSGDIADIGAIKDVEEAREALEDDSVEDDSASYPARPVPYEEKQFQKLLIRTRDSHAHTYNVTIPSMLEEVNATSVKRVNEVCNSIGHFASLITNSATPFNSTSSTLLATQTAADTIQYKMQTVAPPLPDEAEINREEMLALSQTPARKLLNNLQGMFNLNKEEGSLLSPDPLKDIGQKVTNLLDTLRTRTLSGHLVEDAGPNNDFFDDEDDKILDSTQDSIQVVEIGRVSETSHRTETIVYEDDLREEHIVQVHQPAPVEQPMIDLSDTVPEANLNLSETASTVPVPEPAVDLLMLDPSPENEAFVVIEGQDALS